MKPVSFIFILILHHLYQLQTLLFKLSDLFNLDILFIFLVICHLSSSFFLLLVTCAFILQKRRCVERMPSITSTHCYSRGVTLLPWTIESLVFIPSCECDNTIKELYSWLQSRGQTFVKAHKKITDECYYYRKQVSQLGISICCPGGTIT